jgi:hypothetical protein
MEKQRNNTGKQGLIAVWSPRRIPEYQDSRRCTSLLIPHIYSISYLITFTFAEIQILLLFFHEGPAVTKPLILLILLYLSLLQLTPPAWVIGEVFGNDITSFLIPLKKKDSLLYLTSPLKVWRLRKILCLYYVFIMFVLPFLFYAFKLPENKKLNKNK